MTIRGQMLLSSSRKEVSPHYICMGVTDFQPIDRIEEYLIAQEKHKDGNNHLHAYVKYKHGIVPAEKYANAREVFNLVDKPGYKDAPTTQ